MNSRPPQNPDALRAELRRSRERLDALVADLRAADAELEGLASERESHRLVEQACAALEGLRERGAAELFWGAGADGDEHLRQVRLRLDAFDKRVAEVEERRQEILDAIERQEFDTESLAGEVLQAQWQEEQRKLEWSVDREVGRLPYREAVMPWTHGGEDDQRLRKSLAVALLASLLLGFVLPLIELPIPEVWEPVEVPERLTRLIQEQKPLPPPVAPQPTRTAKEDEPKPTDDAKTPEPAPKEKVADTRSKGILAFREQFSALAESSPADRLGAKARVSSAGAAGSARPVRSMVATQAPSSSGGINLASLSRNVGSGGGEGIERVQVVRATSSIGGVGEADRPLSDGPGPSRTDEEIQIVFDRHKAALYRLYNRELRKNPTLQGQMVLRLTIEPDGSVSLCELQSTDMKAPQLSARVVERVKSFDFGAKEGIPPVTILYPIDFLPAA
ncbi:MAG: AgmX/PglI C-terminal domain-containing protein [Myxococcota bacterium]|nr:AgmX/PglI C-terminal domain-containing protein [Myxococcota bacterium]